MNLQHLIRRIFLCDLTRNLFSDTFLKLPPAALSNSSAAAVRWATLRCSALGYSTLHQERKKFRYGQTLKAVDKSPNHSTIWPFIKVISLPFICKICILAYIECRTQKIRHRNSSSEHCTLKNSNNLMLV